MSSTELCRQYLTKPSYNIWHGARAAELDRRHETCGVTPAQAAAMQGAADQRALGAAALGAQLLTPPPPRPILNCHTDKFGNTVCF